MPSSPAPSIALIGGRFLPEALAGEGGMGAVYRAVDTETGRVVALKLLHSAYRPEDAERFTREARLLSALHHPAIVTYIAHGVTEAGHPYLVMEWLEGEDLDARLRRGPLRASEGLALIRCAAEALAVAHARGVVHRDLKPSNLFLRGGDPSRIVLLDFGIARAGVPTRALTGSGMVMGTPGYMAPEQARGDRELNPAADVFSLGCVLYECLTGQPAFAADDTVAVLAKILFAEPPRLHQTRPDLPGSLDVLVSRMLAREPDERLPDAAAVVAALAAIEAPDGGSQADTLEAPAPRDPPLNGEQRLISVLIATPPADAVPDDAGAATRLDELCAALTPLGARAEAMIDGSLVATLVHPGGVATDQAGLAARCALMIRARWPDASIALCTGRGLLRGTLPAGEVLDRAARLLRAPASEQIVLDDLTRGLLDARFHVQKTPSGGYALLGEALTLDAGRPLLGKPTPCVGREAELAMLELTLTGCIEEAVPRAVLVTAPPGAGKSRLRHELLRRVEARGDPLLVLFGRGDPMSAGSAYAVLAQALRRLSGILDGEEPAVQRDKLARRVGEHLPEHDRERVTAFLGEIASIPFPDGDTPKLRAARQDPLVMSDQITEAMLEFLAAECAAHPVLLVLEDLQWGDALTVKLVQAALGGLRDRPLMVLGFARPEALELFPKVWEHHAQRVALRPLSKKAGERLVREVLGAEVRQETVTRIVEQSEGNALFLEELIRGVAEGRGDEAPATVLAMLQARIGRLPAGARRVLRAASVFGEVCWLGGLYALLGAQPAGVSGAQEALALLAEREILEQRSESRFPGEQEHRFRHALMRDAAYGLLTERERENAHRLAGEYLEARGEPDALVLAEHFVKALEERRAIPYFIQAGEQSYDANDMDATLSCAERGLALGAEEEQRSALLSLEAGAYFWREQFAYVVVIGTEAIELLTPGSKRWCRALQWVLPAAMTNGRHDLVASLSARLSGVDPSPDAASYYVCALAWLSTVVTVMGKKDAARAFLQRIEEIAATLEPSDRTAWGHLLGARSSHEHLVEESLWACMLHNQEGMRAFEESGDAQQRGVLASYHGKALLDLGDPVAAEAVLRDNLARTERLDQAYPRTVARTYLARLLAAHAPLDALEEPEQLAHAVIASNNLALIGLAYGVLAEIALRRRDLAVAEEHARVACEALLPFPTWSWDVVALRVRVLLDQARPAEALAIGEAALAELTRLDLAGFGEIHLRLAVAEARDATGQIEAARDMLKQTFDRLRIRVERIPDEAARERYVTAVPTHARLVALAAAWLGLDVRLQSH